MVEAMVARFIALLHLIKISISDPMVHLAVSSSSSWLRPSSSKNNAQVTQGIRNGGGFCALLV